MYEERSVVYTVIVYEEHSVVYTEEEVGRQHQGMDRPGVQQVPEGSGEQGKMEKTGCKIICGSPTTLAVKGLMMMMMMNIVFTVKVNEERSVVLTVIVYEEGSVVFTEHKV